jgi:phenylacetate-coenzyme A ligase PaaK-like adenylate-forming protein
MSASSVYETEAREGLVIDEGIILKLVRPGTGDVVSEGEIGEVVVTTLNRDYPPDQRLAAHLANSLAAVTKLRAFVELVPAGSLPKDGKVIEDVRKYE